ncbi:hypothetical protein FXO38_18941, partial [Capsicum annuum]
MSSSDDESNSFIGQIKEYLVRFKDFVMEGLRKMKDFFVEALQQLKNSFMDMLVKLKKDVVGQCAQCIKNIASELLQELKNFFGEDEMDKVVVQNEGFGKRSETMFARVRCAEGLSHVLQESLSDFVTALDGVIKVKIN